MRYITFLLILLFCFALSSCISVDTGIVKGTGTIVYLNFEGGFYGIIADNGEHYDPINLPSEFKKDGLRVRFKGRIRDDLKSFHMWGDIIELIEIKKL